ncbi:hypothetical protein P2318_28215 [Myxococcaceae bacterium GXIMD 01537]
MAKRTRIIEGTWSCTSCGTQGILGRHKKCTQCNNPRELSGKESEFDFGEADPTSGKSLREGVTDAKALEMAAAGEDWFCAYCAAANRGDSPRCKHCSAERGSDAGKIPEEPAAGPPAPPPPPAAPPPQSKKRTGCLIVAGLALTSFMCCFGFGIWASRTHASSGQVVGTEWQRVVHQERYTLTTKEGWRDELTEVAARMPINGSGESPGVQNVRGCAPQQRGTRQVADGKERVCRTKTRREACGTEEKCTRKKLSNGFMKEECEDVTKYCSKSYEDCDYETRYRNEPVFAQKCAYDTYEWREVNRLDASGKDDAPRWPEVRNTGAHERQRREEKYAVHVEYDDDGVKRYTIEPKLEAEFLAWRKGQQVSLQVDNLGDVQVVEGK